MGQNTSVTGWFYELQEGEEGALQKLWEHFSDRLIEFASQKLVNSPKRLGDEQDVANSVFHCLYRSASAGRLRSVRNRDELWWLLLAMAKQKAIDHQRRENAVKRGAVKTYNPSDGDSIGLRLGGFGLEDLIADEPSTESVAILQEELEHLFKLLPTELHKTIALQRLEGYSISEIANCHSVSSRTVERKLELIRNKWSIELNSNADW